VLVRRCPSPVIAPRRFRRAVNLEATGFGDIHRRVTVVDRER